MSRMAFVGDKNEVFDGRLPATNSYPTLSVAEFQGLFHFLSNETENGMLHRLGLARITVHQELATAVAKHGSLDALSLHWFGDSAAGIVLYKQAVFSLAAHNVIGNKLSTAQTRPPKPPTGKRHCRAKPNIVWCNTAKPWTYYLTANPCTPLRLSNHESTAKPD